MTIRAYPEIYLNSAQSALGDAFDYAVNTCSIPGSEYIMLFLSSTVSERLEKGEALYLAGKSGIEIAADVVLETTGKQLDQELEVHYLRSKEYWIGWAVAYYQWYSGRKYSEIFAALPFHDLEQVYEPLHEADISKFVEIADERVRDHFPDTRLKYYRTLYGCTQAELASRAGISLRSVQMYEQRRKDINKASAESLYRVSKVLGCTMEDLIEK